MAKPTDWELYVEVVPEAIRKDIGDFIQSHAITSYQDFVTIQRYIQAQVLRGYIPPGVADAAVKLAKLQLEAMMVDTAQREALAQRDGGMDESLKRMMDGLAAVAKKDRKEQKRLPADAFNTPYAERLEEATKELAYGREREEE